jgi:signal transduction histidine kinase/ABC-type amino acid transport substrate-binding protein
MKEDIKKHLLLLIVLVIATSAFGFASKSNTSKRLNHDTIIILGDKYYPPYEMVGANGQPEGFAVEVIKEAMKRLGYHYVIKLTERRNIINMVNSSKPTIVLGMSLIDGRSDSVYFGTAFRYVFRNIVMRAENIKRYNNFKDIKNCRIAVEDGSYSQVVLRDSDYAKNATGVTTLKEAFEGLESKKYDVVFCESDVAYNIMYSLGYKDLVAKDACLDPYKFGLGGNNILLLAKLDEMLYLMKKDNTYDRMYKKWFTYDKSDQYQKILYYAISVMVVLAIFIIILRLEVGKTKKKLAEKSRSTTLALKAGDIGVWGYDVRKRKFYNLECDYFPKEGMPYDDEIKLFHPDDLPIFEQAIHDATLGLKVDTLCIRMDRAQKHNWRYIKKDIVGIMSKDGKIHEVIGTRMDVTDTIMKQKKIHALNKKYSTLFNSTVIGTQYYDGEGYLTDTNQAACDIYGIKSKRAILEERPNLFDSPLVKGIFTRENPQPFSGIIKVDFSKHDELGLTLSKSISGIRYLDSHITPIFDDKKKLIGIVANCNDVTEKELLSKKLKESLLRTEMAIKSANMILWELNMKDMTFTCHNDTINHYEGENIPMSLVENNLDDEGKKTFHEHLKKIKEEGERHLCVTVRLHRLSDDSWRNCTLYASAFENTDNCDECGTETTITRYVGFCVDNTDVLQLNHEVEEYSNRMKFMLASIGASEWQYDPYTQVLRTMDLPGNGYATVDWHEMVDLVDDKDKENTTEFFEKMTHCVADRVSLNARVNYPEDNKHIHFAVDGKAYRDVNGKVLFYIGLSNDITGLMDIQLRLEEEKEKALRADRLKSSFLANMSHEIRTPLNAIVGFSQLLTTMKDNDGKRDQFVNIIQTNSDLLIKLINNIMELSKIESGAMDVAPTDFCLHDFLIGFSESKKYQIDKPEVSVKYIKNKQGCLVKTDRMILSRIITELLDNAVKFTPKGNIYLSYLVKDDSVDIAVKDEGIGISEEKKAIVFGKFEKADKFTQGVGLGLSICQESARLIGGKIILESELGKGSCFHVILPKECIMRIGELPEDI